MVSSMVLPSNLPKLLGTGDLPQATYSSCQLRRADTPTADASRSQATYSSCQRRRADTPTADASHSLSLIATVLEAPSDHSTPAIFAP